MMKLCGVAPPPLVRRAGLWLLMSALHLAPSTGALTRTGALSGTGAHTGTHTQLRTAAATGMHAKARGGNEPAVMTPTQFLIISAPKESKICYTQLTNFKATPSGFVSPLVDTGLTSPQGLAIDKTHGYLYVADPDAKSIFRYKLMISGAELSTDGVQVSVVSGREPRWVSCDIAGNLYYTDQQTNAVYKIPFDTIQGIASDKFTSGDLQTVSEAEHSALEAAAADKSFMAADAPPTMAPQPKPIMITLYEAAKSPHVSRPSGIASNGVHVYWANENSGTSRGSVLEGDVVTEESPTNAPTTDPSEEDDSEEMIDHTSHALALNTDTSFGVAITHNSAIFTDNAQFVYGVPLAADGSPGGGVITFTDKLEAPRGIVYDGDGTVYVADQAANTIYSFPCGRLAPTGIDRVVDIHDAFGLALLSETDPGYEANLVKAKGSGRSIVLTWVVAAAGLAFTLS